MPRAPQRGGLCELRHLSPRQLRPLNPFTVDPHRRREQIQSQTPIGAHIPFLRNVPQGRSGHHARQGEPTHPMNGAGHGSAYSGIHMSPRLQPGVGHGVSVNHSRPPMSGSPRLAPSQPYPVAQPANVPLVQGMSGGPYYQQGYFNLPSLAAVTNRRMTGRQVITFARLPQALFSVTVYTHTPRYPCRNINTLV